jgi:hypothetical protein
MSSSSTGEQMLRTVAPSAGGTTHQSILARLDRISVWSLPFMFIGIIGTGFLFAFYDVFDINVSFIQSCVALKHGCTPANAVTALRVPVVLNLAGYVIGALLLAPISDRIGRRNMLLFTSTPDPQHDRARGDAGRLRVSGPGRDRRPVQPQHARPVLRGDFALTDTGANCAVRWVRPRSQDRRTARRSISQREPRQLRRRRRRSSARRPCTRCAGASRARPPIAGGGGSRARSPDAG